MVFGDFSTVTIGLWRTVEITIDSYMLETRGGVRMTALLDNDA